MSKMITIKSYQSPFGEIILGSYKEQLCLCDWKYRKMRTSIDSRIKKSLKSEFQPGDSQTINTATLQLDEYFQNKRVSFDLPLKMIGTDFQIDIWKKLMEIPYGETISYLELAEKAKNPKAIRAIASANGANSIALIIPCHRIIGSDGSMVGYAGGLKVKKELLKLEGVNFDHQMSLF
ncbi:cysteine methyltransferase [Mangrovivirga cuniculi]|uniref:methylated-DNA--[protein]-cysteine S-methyltransferase n=2 Tax=Mangrovivirga cuniculi TaxID=2715131 RepID=A0A4D7K7E7_9BACT|nr:cysteine methyltransferase [Mangrovivirga cuniculi]